MREMTREELRDCQLKMLIFFDNICKENNIKYWVDYGTLLGAIRHKGYIPWDDDIDVAMLRGDYDKLISVFRLLTKSRYKLSCVELDPSCMYPFGKVIDVNTVLYELGENGIKTSVYIDVFVYDDAPENKSEREQIFNKLEKLGRLRNYQLPMSSATFSLKRAIVIMVRGLLKVLPRQFFTRMIVSEARKNIKNQSKYISDFTCPYSYSRWCVEKAFFNDIIEVEFEGLKFKAPKKYDEWLRLHYGDYMKLPSEEEQRAAQHRIKAYYKD